MEPTYGDFAECPYDKAHRMLSHRLATHLVKCRKNHPNAEKVKCPFNSTHLINKPELNAHVLSCPDKSSFDKYKYSVPSKQTKIEPTEQPKFIPVESEENWDDCDEPTYDPRKYAENAPVIRQLNVAPPSQRKAFAEAERIRLTAMNRKNN